MSFHARQLAAAAWASAVLAGLGGSAAQACTTCDSDSAQAVRAQLFDAAFAANAAAVLAPVPLLAAAILLVGAAPTRARRDEDG